MVVRVEGHAERRGNRSRVRRWWGGSGGSGVGLAVAQNTGGKHLGPANAEGHDLAFYQAARVSAQVAKLGHFDAVLESVDALDLLEWMTVVREVPEAEELVVQAAVISQLCD